ncbi:hypothetical protein CRUP_033857 [Coryphaenoides rupestris]|nr:hypothetical protein CRUP_033857 [Coryphaenoides rupestris]
MPSLDGAASSRSNSSAQQQAFTTPGSDIPQDLLNLSYPPKRGDFKPARQPSHPSKKYFAVAEKGDQPHILVYEYPSLRPYRILRGGTGLAYSYVDFNPDGSLLASVGTAPDYLLTVWDWRQELVLLRCKAFPPRRIYRVEVCRKEKRSCHAGAIQQFSLDKGELMTFGADGAIRTWDFEIINAANAIGDSGLFEMEPMNELLVGGEAAGSLCSLVRSSLPDSSVWFAQSEDPECLFSCHAGLIQGMDVSSTSHLMATTTLDRESERQFAGDRVRGRRGAAAGAVRRRGNALSGGGGDTELRLKQALKPHNAPVTAIAYERNGAMLATGSAEGTVFFFAVGEQHYKPVVATWWRSCLPNRRPRNAPATYQLSGLTTRTFCFRSIKSRIKEEAREPTEEELKKQEEEEEEEEEAEEEEENEEDVTILLSSIPDTPSPPDAVASALRPGKFCLGCPCTSLSSEGQIRDPEEERRTSPFAFLEVHDADQDPILTITSAGPSVPVSLGANLLGPSGLHDNQYGPPDATIEASRQRLAVEKEQQEAESSRAGRRGELLQLRSTVFFFAVGEQHYKPVGLLTSTLLVFCASGHVVEVVPPEPEAQNAPATYQLSGLTTRTFCFRSIKSRIKGGYDAGFLYHCKFSEQEPDRDPEEERRDEPFAFLEVHDADQDPILTITFSHDDRYVLTAGDDGKHLLPERSPEDNAPPRGGGHKAKLPSPRGVEAEGHVTDIEDAAAYSIEASRQRLAVEKEQQEAESSRAGRRGELLQLRSRFKDLLLANDTLPEHTRLPPAASLEMRSLKRSRYMLHFRGSGVAWPWDTVMVAAVDSEHRLSTYRLPARADGEGEAEGEAEGEGGGEGRARGNSPGPRDRADRRPGTVRNPGAQGVQVDGGRPHTSPTPDPSTADGCHLGPGASKLARLAAERVQRAAEKAERAQAKIDAWKKKWAELNAAKPHEAGADPAETLALQQARDNMGDFKLKTDRDYTVPEHLRVNADKKRAELVALEEQVRLVSRLRGHARRLQRVQRHLPPHLHLQGPALPALRPDEVPERRLRCGHQTEEAEGQSVLEQLEQEMLGVEEEEEEEEKEEEEEEEEEEDVEEREDESPPYPPFMSGGFLTPSAADASELEREMRAEQEIRLVDQRDRILEEVEIRSVC